MLQARIDDPSAHDEVTLGLRHLLALSKILRQRRKDRGALELASPEVKFEIDTETHDPMDVGMYQVRQCQRRRLTGNVRLWTSCGLACCHMGACYANHNQLACRMMSDGCYTLAHYSHLFAAACLIQTRETNSMVEEMMLLANISVAEFTLVRFASCALLRRHQAPPPRQFEPLLRAAAAAGFTLDTATSAALAQSLDGAVRPSDKYFNSLVRIMATRCMMQAQYIGSGEVAPPEYHHYGLAAPLYTHFTSPIRRWGRMVVVHCMT